MKMYFGLSYIATIVWLICLGLGVSLFLSSQTVPIQYSPSLVEYPSLDTPIDVNFIIKLFISIMLLIIGYLFSKAFNNILSELKELRTIVYKSSIANTLANQTTKQVLQDIKILNKRINRLNDWKTKHDSLHQKLDK